MDVHDLLKKVKHASRAVVLLTDETRVRVLNDLADALESRKEEIVSANARDLSRMDASDPQYDRLLLNDARIAGIAHDIRAVAALPSPVHQALEHRVVPSGLELTRVAV